ncbi:MAG: MBL fold metallo-hydrolase [Fidelibacterota bacterium]|nr:MAG: MBL fold metallo-hydrolase [Candidatus Neomarinimicrobiota bacterium]
MKNATHTLRFWGVRGSIPTADTDKYRIGGDTSCVEFAPSEGTHIIFDGGTGVRGVGNAIGREHEKPYDIHLFLSHTHWDHIIGLPFFAPIHQSFAHIHLYGPKRAGNSLEHTIQGLFSPPFFPLRLTDIQAKITFVELEPGRHEFANGFVVECAPHPHPNGAMSYRVEAGDLAIAYITDIEHTKDRLVPSVLKLSRGVDALIHDSHFHCEDLPSHRSWGHSSWVECTEVALKAGVKKLFLFHFSPNYSDEDVFDMEQRARNVFPDTTAAYQGLTVEFPVT